MFLLHFRYFLWISWCKWLLIMEYVRQILNKVVSGYHLSRIALFLEGTGGDPKALRFTRKME